MIYSVWGRRKIEHYEQWRILHNKNAVIIVKSPDFNYYNGRNINMYKKNYYTKSSIYYVGLSAEIWAYKYGPIPQSVRATA